MTELRLHGSTVETVFDLLGRRENDMTYALGWGLARSDAMLRGMLDRIAPDVPFEAPALVDLQEHDSDDRGYTDIEILAPTIHVIVEAKRGWRPPSAGQLQRYEARLARGGRPSQWIAILTQNGAESIVQHQLGDWKAPPPVKTRVLGWSDVVSVARRASHGGPLAERRLVSELATYLRGVADMRNTDSNSVFVVSLSSRIFNDSWKLTTVEIVEEHDRYFFPATGENWPKTPPNYVAFRYGGRLQSIRHVDDYAIVSDMSPFFPGAPDTSDWVPHFLMTLGPPIRPSREVRTGAGIVRSARVWVDIDLLLTCSTITEALQATKRRRNG